MLHRVFRHRPGALSDGPGGPLFVPRERQGSGRHDEPSRYGAFYAARSPEAAVAETIQAFRGRDLSDDDLIPVDGSVLTLAVYDDAGLPHVGVALDLDSPAVLLEQGWRPSEVASRDRAVTHAMAARAWDQGALGLSWWSTLDSAWTNVTLFAERTLARGAVRVVSLERLDTAHAAVALAADRLVISLVPQPRRRGSRARQ